MGSEGHSVNPCSSPLAWGRELFSVKSARRALAYHQMGRMLKGIHAHLLDSLVADEIHSTHHFGGISTHSV